jgi:glycosyltransferase involved in cell wall biosynthesis
VNVHVTHFYVLLKDNVGEFYADDQLICSRPLGEAPSALSLTPVSTLSHEQMSEEAVASFPNSLAEAPRELKLHGVSLKVPPQKSTRDLRNTQHYIASTLIPFLSTNSFPKDAVFITAGFAGSALAAGFVARLYGGSKVYAVSDDTALIATLKKNNALGNLELLRTAEVSALLGGGGLFRRRSSSPLPHVVLIGDATHIMGPSGLLAQVRKASVDHSLCVLSETEIPGNQIFGETGTEYDIACTVAVVGPQARALTHHGSHYAKVRHGVDIVIPMYNSRNYIVQCISSLLVQGRNDIRVIVVDDESSDGSGDVVRRSFGSNPNVTLLRKPNGGCASARNYGMMHSDASHITFVDADDFVDAGMFAQLYDLALYTGCEIVQGGFLWYEEDPDGKVVRRPSYEVSQFANHPVQKFRDREIIHIHAHELVLGQPSIWRRVYRRDFLRAKRLSFVENIRAYDDYLFHLESIYAARSVFMIKDLNYQYRQHPSQDIKQGDERHFYELYMFRLLLIRSLEHGWHDFNPFMRSVINTVNWSTKIIRDDLVTPFLKAAAEFCVAVEKCYGENHFGEAGAARIEHTDFRFFYKAQKEATRGINGGAMWAYISSLGHHPDTLRLVRANKF